MSDQDKRTGVFTVGKSVYRPHMEKIKKDGFFFELVERPIKIAARNLVKEKTNDGRKYDVSFSEVKELPTLTWHPVHYFQMEIKISLANRGDDRVD